MSGCGFYAERLQGVAQCRIVALHGYYRFPWPESGCLFDEPGHIGSGYKDCGFETVGMLGYDVESLCAD